MSTDSHVLELLPGYVLDCLDEEDQILVSEHLAVCSVCQAELQSYQTVADQLALAGPETVPSPELKRRLMDRLQTPSPSRPDQAKPSGWQSMNFSRRFGLIWGLVSLLLILVLVGSNLLLWQRLNRLEATSPGGGMRAIALSSTGVVPEASGFVLISADGRNGALVVDQLPPLEAEQQYQLWLIRNGGQPTSGAIFSVDEDGYGGVRITAPRSLFEYSAVDITIEPVEGSPAPSGATVLDGRLN